MSDYATTDPATGEILARSPEATDAESAVSQASQVSAQDFADILAQTRAFVREVVMPREQEIADTDRIPDDIRRAAADMGLFGYAIP